MYSTVNFGYPRGWELSEPRISLCHVSMEGIRFHAACAPQTDGTACCPSVSKVNMVLNPKMPAMDEPKV